MQLAVLLACLAVAFGEYAETDDVKILTVDNFDATISGNEFVLAEFYAPWCGHCKNLEPHYKKAASALKAAGSNVVLGALDATLHGEVASKFGVKGYPTLKWFRNGVPSEYGGGRTEETIISWINKHSGPPAKELATAADVEAFAAANKIAVIGFFAAASGDAFKAFESVASSVEDVNFGYTTDLAAGATYGLENGDGVVLLKPFDEKKNLIEEFTTASLSEFVESYRHPLVIPFSMEVVPQIFQSKVGVSALLFTKDETVPYLQAIAEKNRGKIVIATADDHEPRLLDHLGIKASDFPKLIVLDTKNNGLKYRLEGEVNAETVEAHIAAFFAGSLKPFLKSEPVPATNDEPVKVVVGGNFESIVLDASKHVFLEVYAPWCGHCKKLAPIWDELGAAFEGTNVVIAKMEGTANEVEGINIKGFPTLFWFPAGAKTAHSGKEYNGAREFDDLKSYIESNSGVSGKDDDDVDGDDYKDEL